MMEQLLPHKYSRSLRIPILERISRSFEISRLVKYMSKLSRVDKIVLKLREGKTTLSKVGPRESGMKGLSQCGRCRVAPAVCMVIFSNSS